MAIVITPLQILTNTLIILIIELIIPLILIIILITDLDQCAALDELRKGPSVKAECNKVYKVIRHYHAPLSYQQR